MIVAARVFRAHVLLVAVALGSVGAAPVGIDARQDRPGVAASVDATIDRWVEIGYWNDERLMTTEPFTVRGPWRIRWTIAAGQPVYMMLLDGDTELLTFSAERGMTHGVFEEQQSGTFSLMFHNTVPYEVIVEQRAAP